MKFPFPVQRLARQRVSSFDQIESDIKPRSHPVVLEGLLDSWRACSLWSRDYLAECLASDSLTLYVSPDRFFPGEYPASPDGKTKQADGRRTEKIAGRDLFRRLERDDKEHCYVHAVALPPQLEADIGGAIDKERMARFMWISRQGHVTPTHFDGSQNVLAQVRGSKTLILFPPEDFQNLYVYGCDHRYARHSQVFDLENVSLEDFPNVANLRGHMAVLNPGDALYIPNFWWHCAYSLSLSISVNTWWNDAPFPRYEEMMADWTGLRSALMDALPAEMSLQYKTYFSRVLLFGDMR